MSRPDHGKRWETAGEDDDIRLVRRKSARALVVEELPKEETCLEPEFEYRP